MVLRNQPEEVEKNKQSANTRLPGEQGGRGREDGRRETRRPRRDTVMINLVWLKGGESESVSEREREREHFSEARKTVERYIVTLALTLRCHK